MTREPLGATIFFILIILVVLSPVWAAKRWKPKWTKPHPGWKKYKTKNFDFYYAPNSILARPGAIKKFAEKRERAYAAICKYLKIKDRRRIKFFVYDSNEVARKIIGRNAGFAQSTVAIIHSRINQTVGHELTHVLSRAINGRPPPNRVLDEGLAVFLDQSKRDYFAVAKSLLTENNLPSFEDMLEASKTSSEEWYPAAGAFVGFLCEKYGTKRFKYLWAAKQTTFKRDFRKIYRKRLSEIEKEWRDYLNSYKPTNEAVLSTAKPAPRGWDVVFYDDCGNPKAQPHLKSGYNDILGKPHPKNKPSENTLVASHKEIKFYYKGLNPKASYYIRVTYAQSLNQGRIQTLHAGPHEVHGPLALPKQEAQQHDFPLPPQSYTDGNLTLQFRKVGGPQATAIVSEIWIMKIR